VPLTFELSSTPAQALKSYRWRQRPDGINWTCEATVAPPTEGAVIRWESLVLVNDRARVKLPRTSKPEVTKSLEDWTRSTACVQSSDPAIQAQALKLSKDAPDLGSYARSVAQFTATNYGKPGSTFDTLDARKALDCGGSCTSRANLAAALLRARGVPARTLAHLPTWSGPLYEHWLVEYWHPGVGWIWLETSQGVTQPAPWTVVVLNVAGPADEDKSLDPIHLRYVMPGAPYLSTCLLSKELLRASGLVPGACNVAVPVARLEGTQKQVETVFAAARKAHARLIEQGLAGRIDPKRNEAISTAAETDPAAELEAALLKASGSGE
jgi:hypothetical protein